MMKNIFFNKFSVDKIYYALIILAILFGVDIASTTFVIENKLGTEGNIFIAWLVGSPILHIILKSIGIVMVFMIIMYMKEVYKNYTYNNIAVTTAILVPISTYIVIQAWNISHII